MGALIGGIIIFYLVWLAVAITAFVFWLRMLIKAAKHEFEHKPLWILVIILGNIIGALVFYFVIYREKIKPQKTSTYQPHL